MPLNQERLLITGDSGFVGHHALAKWPGAVGLSSISKDIDIRDSKALSKVINDYRPTSVLHLAAQSFVPDSFNSPSKTFDVNLIGTLRLLESLNENNFAGKFLFVGTGDAYGLVPINELPVKESRPLMPRNPYAVSKIAAEALCFQWSQTCNFEIFMARPFNHIGSHQSANFAISDFARQLARVSSSKGPGVITVGNIDVTRDFTDVNDVLHAYELIFEHGKKGSIYNICSGIERSLRWMLERLISLTGLNVEIKVDQDRLRPSEQTRMFGSYKLLLDHTGWKPSTHIDQTLTEIYRYWNNKND